MGRWRRNPRRYRRNTRASADQVKDHIKYILWRQGEMGEADFWERGQAPFMYYYAGLIGLRDMRHIADAEELDQIQKSNYPNWTREDFLDVIDFFDTHTHSVTHRHYGGDGTSGVGKRRRAAYVDHRHYPLSYGPSENLRYVRDGLTDDEVTDKWSVVYNEHPYNWAISGSGADTDALETDAGRLLPIRKRRVDAAIRESLRGPPKRNPRRYRQNRKALNMDYGPVSTEGLMLKSQLTSMRREANKLHGMLEDNDNLPGWVNSKVATALDRLSTSRQYIESKLDRMGYLENPASPPGLSLFMFPSVWSNLGPVADRMFEIDHLLSMEAKNWNHNLADYLRGIAKAEARGKVRHLRARFALWGPNNPGERRGYPIAIAEIRAIDPQLAARLEALVNTDPPIV